MSKFKKGTTRWAPCKWTRWLRRHDDRAVADITSAEITIDSSWKTRRPWSDAEPTGLKLCEPVTLTGAWDTTALAYEHRLTGLDENGVRDLNIRFPRWPRLWPLYLLPYLPRWCFKTWTGEVKLASYKVVATQDEMVTCEVTMMPKGEGEWT